MPGPWSFYIFVRGPVAPAVLPPVFLKLIWRHKNTGGKTAGATENIGAQLAECILPGDGHARPLHVVVGSFKSAVSRRLGAVWQRSYWERVVRSGEELDQIRGYIEDNPLRWPVDPEFSHQ